MRLGYSGTDGDLRRLIDAVSELTTCLSEVPIEDVEAVYQALTCQEFVMPREACARDKASYRGVLEALGLVLLHGERGEPVDSRLLELDESQARAN